MTLVIPTLAMAAAWLPEGRRRGFHGVARWWARRVLFWCNVKLTVRQEGELDWDQTLIAMSNHESQFVIPILFAGIPQQNMGLLAKHALRNIPVFGWAQRAAAFIFMDRTDPEKAKRSIDQAVGQVQNGTSVAVLPEGARGISGERLSFKKGGFVLAVKSGVPVLPVVLHGAKDLQHEEDFGPHSGAVEARIGAPVASPGYSFDTRDEYLGRVRGEMEKPGRLP